MFIKEGSLCSPVAHGSCLLQGIPPGLWRTSERTVSLQALCLPASHEDGVAPPPGAPACCWIRLATTPQVVLGFVIRISLFLLALSEGPTQRASGCRCWLFAQKLKDSAGVSAFRYSCTQRRRKRSQSIGSSPPPPSWRQCRNPPPIFGCRILRSFLSL